jgi:hypothetical protein
VNLTQRKPTRPFLPKIKRLFEKNPGAESIKGIFILFLRSELDSYLKRERKLCQAKANEYE